MQQDMDSGWLEDIFERYATRLLRMAMVYLRDEGLAEDAVQETLLKLHRHRHRRDPERSEQAWVMRIAVNTCKDMLRRRRPGQTEFCETMDDLPGREAGPGDGELIEAVRALPSKYRDAVLLYYYQDLPVRDVASALHCSQGAVRVRLSRAREMLRTQWKGWDLHEPDSGSDRPAVPEHPGEPGAAVQGARAGR